MLRRSLRFLKLYLAGKSSYVYLFLIVRGWLYSRAFSSQLPDRRLARTILFVEGSTPQCDRDAGSLSIIQFMQLFASHGWQVHLWPFDQIDNLQARSDLERKGIDVILSSRRPDALRTWMSRRASQYNVVFVSRPALAAFLLPWLRNRIGKFAYYGHDLHGERFLQEALLTGHCELRLLSRKYRKIEREICLTADCSYYPSAQEVQIMKASLPEASIKELPPYVFDSFDLEIPVPSAGAHFLFVGNFEHLPNLDAALWLLNEIWPSLRERLGDAHLTIAGSRPPADLIQRARPDCDNVTITGWISDQRLNELYRASRVVVVPLRYGSGIKHKVISAIMKGRPVVTTDIGLQGLPELEDSVGLACNNLEFVRHCELLVNNEQLWSSRVLSARTALAARFSRESVWKALQDLHQDI